MVRHDLKARWGLDTAMEGIDYDEYGDYHDDDDDGGT